MLKGSCVCGTEVWAGARPRPRELVICPHCFRDNSTPAPLRWYLAYTWARVRHRKRLYGCWRGLVMSVAQRVWVMERKRAYPEAVERLKKRGTGPWADGSDPGPDGGAVIGGPG